MLVVCLCAEEAGGRVLSSTLSVPSLKLSRARGPLNNVEVEATEDVGKWASGPETETEESRGDIRDARDHYWGLSLLLLLLLFLLLRLLLLVLFLLPRMLLHLLLRLLLRLLLLSLFLLQMFLFLLLVLRLLSGAAAVDDACVDAAVATSAAAFIVLF